MEEDNNLKDIEHVAQDNIAVTPTVEPKKSRAKLIGMIATIAACILIVGTVFAKVALPTLLPKLFVADAIKTTQKALIKETKAVEEITGITLQEQIMQSEAMQSGYELNLKDMTGLGPEEIKAIIQGMGLSSEVKKDKENQKIVGNFAINQGPLRLVGADFYKSGEEVGVAIPELFEKYLSVQLETFVKDYNASALYTMTGEPIDEKQYNAMKNYFDTYSKQRFNEDLLKKLSARSEEVFKGADIKYIGKTKVKVGEKDQAYKTYELVFKEAEIKSYLKDIAKIVIEDKVFSEYINALDAMEQPGQGEKTSDVMKQALIDFNKGIDELESLNLKTKLMIDNKKHIVESIYEVAIGANGENTDMKIDAALTGKKFITDAMKLSFASTSKEEKVGLDFASTSNYGEGVSKLSHQMKLDITEKETSQVQMNLDMTYDTKAKEKNLVVKAGVKAPDQIEISALIEGNMNLNKANKQMDMTMDNITVGAVGGFVDHTLALTGKYNMKAIKVSDIAAKPENVQELFKMTEEELTALIQKASTSMTEIGNTLMQ